MFINDNKIKRIISPFVIISSILLLEAFFFRNVLFNDNLFGDFGDGRLTMLFTEHWFRFFTGKEAFNDLLMFYPVNNVIGYSDMFFVFGCIHSIFRFLGIDVYFSYKITLIIVHVFGTVSMFYLLRNKLNINIFWCFIGILGFNFSTTYSIHAFAHTQLSAVAMLPMLTIFLINFFNNFYADRKRKNINALAFIFWFALIAYNSWYIAFFTIVFCLILFVSYIINLALNKKISFTLIKNVCERFKIDLLLYLIFAVLIFVPFIYVYLPILRTSGGYVWNETFCFLPEFIDIINVTDSNYLLGNLISNLNLGERGLSGELSEGFSIVLLTLFIISFIKLSRTNCEKGYSLIFKYSLGLSVLLGVLFIIRLSSSGVSFWYFIWKYLPGGKSVRVVSRFLFYLSFPMSLFVSIYGNSIFEKVKNKKLLFIIFSSLVCFSFLSSARHGGVYSIWNRKTRLEFIENIPNPPVDSECFYIMASPNDNNPELAIQMEAFEIANKFDLKTINGYSGSNPNGWDRIWFVKSKNYKTDVSLWMLRNGIKDIYCYNKQTNAWELHDSELKYYFSDNQFSQNATDSFNIRTIHPAGISYGPYWSVPSGSYKVTIEGENLNSAFIDVYHEHGQKHDVFQKDVTDGRIVLNIKLESDVQDFEVFIRNDSLSDIKLKSFVMEKD